MKHFTLTLIAICLSVLTFGQVGPINGAASVCVSFTTALSDATPGGVWSSSNGAVATIGSATGIVTGLGSGTTTITYTVGASQATKGVTVNQLPGAITGAAPVCVAQTLTLRDVSPGGTWSSSNSAAGTISTTGIVTGVSAGSTTITYQFGTGCYTTANVTVNPLPAAITGAGAVCQGTSITLSDPTPGGTWSSSNTHASVGSVTGIVTGSTLGSAAITYKITSTGCTAAANVTVTAVPSVIYGTFSVCKGTTTTLNDGTTGGNWTSGDVSIATIGSTTGLVTGIAPGTTPISYNVGGCTTTKTMTVTAPPPISGTSRVCKNATTTLTDPVNGGVWTSTNTTIATIGSTTGIVTGKAPGIATISYTKAGCASTLAVTVLDTAAAITGTPHVCAGSATTLSNATIGGTWSSSNASIATVGSATGVVTGITAGNCTITYSTGCGAVKTTSFTVNVQPSAITGPAAVCTSSTIALGNAASGGIWSSGDNTIATVGSSSGIVTGVASGNATITYTLGYCSVNTTLTVDELLTPGSITGTTTICVASSTTLTNAGHTGTWSSSNASVASIDGAGVVTGMTAGTATISFTQSNRCMTAYTTTLVTVNTVPSASAISGNTNVCAGNSSKLTATEIGGIWSSGDMSVATIDSTGVVTGIAAGIATITYSVSNSCGTTLSTTTVTIHPIPSPIAGIGKTCVGSSYLLTNGMSGGTWTSSDTSVATIDGKTGLLTGIVAGGSNITYTSSAGCIVSSSVTVGDIAPISGATTLSLASPTPFTDAVPGGTWSSSDMSIAIIDAAGNAIGISPGIATITYTAPSGCIATLDVVSAPLELSGSDKICVGLNSTLTASYPGGMWTSSNLSIASVDPSTGVVSGVHKGATRISYTIGAQRAYMTVTVYPMPAPLTGDASACPGATTSLYTSLNGGTWSSSDTTIATAVQGSFGGVITGIREGVAIISYTMPSGCAVDTTVVIHPLPAPITGNPQICIGATTTLSDATPGGTWSYSNTNVSVSLASGIVSGHGIGAAIITYTSIEGCRALQTVTVNALPSVIYGGTVVEPGGTTLLHSGSDGGVWSSDNMAIATCSGTGCTTTLAGVSIGSAIVSYTMPATGCSVTTIVSVSNDGARSGQHTVGANSSISEVFVYPNPTSGPDLMVTTPVGGILKVYTLDGRALQQYEMKEGNNTIALPDTLPGGVYLSIFKGTDGSTTTTRIVYRP